MDYKLADLIDVHLLQNLQEKLNLVYSFPSAILDNEGKILTAVAWQDICTKFHRMHPDCEKECIKSDQYIMDHLHEANPAVSYQCPHGLVDNATPIIIEGKHYGNFFTGQFFLTPPDIEFFRQQAKKYGFDETAYLDALKKVPVWSKEKLHLYLDFIKGFIEMIASIGLKNLKEASIKKELNESETKYYSILQQASDGIFLADAEGNYFEVNTKGCEILGYTREEILKLTIKDIIQPEDYPIQTSSLNELKKGNVQLFERTMVCKDGTKIIAEISTKMINENCFLGIVRDITDYKQKEEELKLLKERLELSIEASNIGIWSHDLRIDPDRTKEVSVRNLRHDQLFGYNEKIESWGVEKMLEHVISEDKPIVKAAFDNLLNTGLLNFECSIQWADKSIHWISVKGKVYKDDKGNPIKVNGTVIDISDRKKAEEKLKENEHFLIASQKVGHVGSYVTELPSGIWHVSPEMYQILGVDENYPHTLEGFLKLIHPDSIEDFLAYYNKVETEKLRFDYKYKIIRINDKAVRWVHGLGDYQFDENNIAIKLIGTIQDITEHKLADEKIKVSEEKYRLMVENSGLGVGVYGLDGTIQYFNQKALDNLGGKPEDYIGKSLIECFGETRGAEYIQRFKNAINCDTTLEYEDYVETVDGGKWFYSNQTVIKDANGNIKGVQVLAKEITERKNAEEKIKENEEKYRELVENSPDAIVIYEQGIVKFVNKKSYEILAASENDSIIGKPIIEFVHPDSKDLVVERMKKLATENTILPFIEEKLLKFDGNAAEVELKAIPIKLEGRKAVQLIIRDITEKNHFINQLKQSEKNLDTFFNTIDDMLFVLDKNGNIIHANNRVYQKLGFSIEDLSGKSLLMIHPQELRDEVGRVIFGVINKQVDFCAIPIITKSGILIPVETKLSEGIWNNKAVIFAVTKDISKIKLSEEKFSKVFYLNPSACGLTNLSNGEYIEINDAFSKLLGFTKDEIIGKTPKDLGILSTETINDFIQQVDEKGKGYNIETILKAKNGDIKHVLLSAETIYIQDKIYQYTVVNDITERKQTEEKIKKAEQYFKSLIEKSTDGIVLLNEKGEFKYISLTTKRMFGYDKNEEITGNPATDTHPDDLEMVLSEMSKLFIDTTYVPKLEYRYRTKDGSWKWVETIFSNMLADPIVEAIVLNFRDITERKYAEEKIKESKLELQNIFNNLQDAYFQADIKGIFTKVSPSAVRMYRYKSAEEMIGMPAVNLYANPKERDEIIGKLKEKHKIEDYVSIGIRKDRTTFGASMNLQFIYNEAGQIIGTTGVVRDVSERKLFEERLKNANRIYNVLSKTNQAIVKFKDPIKLFEEVCKIAIDDGNFRMVWIGEIDESINKVVPVTSAGYVNGYLDNINLNLNDEILSAGPTGKAAKTGVHYISRNIAENPEMQPWREKALRNGYYTSAAFPIITNGKVTALLTIYADQSYFFNEEEINLIDILAKDISNALEFIELEVIRKETAKNLKESEEILSLYVKHSPIYTYIKEVTPTDSRVIKASDNFIDMIGISGSDIIGKSMEEIYPAAFAAKISKEDWEVVSSGKIIKIDEEYEGRYYITVKFPIIQGGRKLLSGYTIDITERKLAEEKLNDSLTRYQSLTNNLEAGIVVHTLDTSIIMNNQRACELLGLSEDQMKGKLAIDPRWKFIHENNSPLTLDEYPVNKVIATNASFNNYTLGVVVPENNNIVWLMVNGTPIFNSNGEMYEILISFFDITERKLGEVKLKESESRLQGVLDNSNTVVFIKDIKGRYLLINSTFEKLFHVNKESIINKTDYDVFSKEIADKFMENDNLALEKGEALEVVETVPQDDGIHYYISTKFPLIDSNGKPYAVCGIATDYTQFKLAEEKLREKDNEFRKLSANVPDLIYQFTKRPDGSYCVPVASEGIKNIFGCTPEDVIDDFGPIGSVIYPEDAERVINEIEYSAKHLTHFTCEFRVKIPGREIQWIYSNSTPEKLADGSITWYGFNTDITIRKLAEERLKENEIKYRNIFENAQEGIFQTNIDGTYISVNPALAKMYGFDSPEELIKSRLDIAKDAYYNPNEREKFLKVINEHGFVKGYEYEVKRKDGTKIWFYEDAAAIKDVNGEIKHFEGFVIDITERKLAEEKLKENEESLRIIFNTSPSAIYIKDHNGVYLMVNNKFAERHNTIPSKMVGLQDISFAKKWLTNTEQIEKFRASERKVIENKETLFIPDEKFVYNDGTIKWYQSTKSQITIKDNPNYLMCVSTDISELKLKEQDLIKASEQIINSEYRIKLAVSTGQLGIWDWNIKDNTMIWDARMFELYGITKDDSPNNIDAWTNGLHPDDKQMALDECNAALKGEKDFNTIFRVLHPNGNILYLKADGTVIRDSEGEAIRMIGINKDITKSKLSEQELIIAKERAEESDRLKSAFLANMSHEIRTPMNGILGFSELLKEPGLTGEEQQEYIRIIEKSGARMLNIINDIVDISKIEAGLMEISLSESNINEQIDYVYTFFKPEVEAKGMKLFFNNKLPSREANIQTDHEKFYAILINLVKNAIKYSIKGSIEIGYVLKTQKTVNEKSNCNELEFYVKDTGIGIPENRQQAIFERFIQADISDKRAYQGAGLGLAITKSYVELLGGKIWVESEEGIGSCFYFTIPYNNVIKEEIIFENFVKREEEVCPFKNLKILIADDDETSRLLIAMSIKKISKEIIEVETGLEVIDALKKARTLI
ncbi:MAG: PAS domain S-box protein [Bacteroidales bacterium]